MMLGEILKRPAESLIADNEENIGDDLNNDNKDNINVKLETIDNTAAGRPAKVAKTEPDYVIILDDDSENEYEEYETKPSQTKTQHQDYDNTQPPFLPNEPLLLVPSDVNLYYAASNNTSSSNFDPEIFDMQFTAQGDCSTATIGTMYQYFLSKRTHIKAAKQHSKFIILGKKVILMGVHPVISKPHRISHKRMKFMEYDDVSDNEDGDIVVFTRDEEEEEEDDEDRKVMVDFIDDRPVVDDEETMSNEFGEWYNSWVANGEGELHPLLEHEKVTQEQQLRFSELNAKITAPAVTDDEWAEFYRLNHLHNIVKKEERKSDLQESLLYLCRSVVPTLSQNYSTSSPSVANQPKQIEMIDVDAEDKITHTTTTTTSNTTTTTTTTEIKKNVKRVKRLPILPKNPLTKERKENTNNNKPEEGQQKYVPGTLTPIADDVITRYTGKGETDQSTSVGQFVNPSEPIPLGTLQITNNVNNPLLDNNENINIKEETGNGHTKHHETTTGIVQSENRENGQNGQNGENEENGENGERIEGLSREERRMRNANRPPPSSSVWGGEIDDD